MDVNMPGIDGIEATRRIVDATPHVAILVLTMHDDDETVFEAVRAGARGYLLKGAQRAELMRAIRAVASGEAIFGPGVARRLMAFFARPAPRVDRAAFPELTDREREILELIAQGRSNAEITPTARPVAEDRAQPRLQHLRQAPGRATAPRRSCAHARPGMGGGRAPRAAGPGGSSRDTDRDTGPMTAGRPGAVASVPAGLPSTESLHGPLVLAPGAALVAGVFVACCIVQVFLAGLGVFDDPRSFVTHRDFGYLLGWFTLAMLVLALVGREPRRIVGLSVLVLVQFVLQSVFVALRADYPAIAALHPVNGFLILAVGAIIARLSWQVRHEASTSAEPATAATSPAASAEAR